MTRACLLVALCALAAPAFASAHGSTSYVATIRAVEPPLAGVHVEVAHGFQVVLTSHRRDPVVVAGANGVPLWRFTRAGVAANLAGRDSRPEWVVVTPKHTFAWPDPRAGEPAGKR